MLHGSQSLHKFVIYALEFFIYNWSIVSIAELLIDCLYIHFLYGKLKFRNEDDRRWSCEFIAYAFEFFGSILGITEILFDCVLTVL